MRCPRNRVNSKTTRAILERHSHWFRLQRIVASIPQLISQDGTVALVGFLGHFSSGKSTLINALLGIKSGENPPYRRKTGEQPTDRGISLTTHPKNFEAVRRQFTFGDSTLSVIEGPVLPMLECMTLVDTPGLGDDPNEMDLVVKFLHLVHVLVLPVHSRTPFADSEKAFDLLNVAFNELADVPKIFVITNAATFLTSRKGDFDKDWDRAGADKFWNETITRLLADKRVLARRNELTSTPVIHVDSIEEFQVDKVRDMLLPIVTSAEQRSRTDRARRNYVFRRAALSLRHLEKYINSRCTRLTELQQTAEGRSKTTKTSIDALIAELTGKLAAEVQSLPVNQQHLTTLADPLDQIVTVAVIQGAIETSEIERGIKKKLNARAMQRLAQTTHQAMTAYDSRKAGVVFPYESRAITPEDVERAIHESSLEKGLRKCASSSAQHAKTQYGQRLSSGLAMLDSTSETFRVRDALHGIEAALIAFQRAHDDSVRSLMAYVTEAETLTQLQESGLLSFDDSGQRRQQVELIDPFVLRDYNSIEEAVNACEIAIREVKALADEEGALPARVDVDSDPSADERTGRSVFERQDLQPIVDHVAQQVAASVAKFDSEMSSAIDAALNEAQAKVQDNAACFKEIWSARRAIVLRFTIVVTVIGAIAALVMYYNPTVLPRVVESVIGSPAPDWIVEGVVGLPVSFAVGLAVFVLTGITNPNVKAALTSIGLLRLRAWWQGRVKRRMLRATARALLKDTPSGIANLDVACRDALMKWIRTRNSECVEVYGNLSKARDRVNVRARNIGNLATQIAPWVANLPKALLQRSEEIRRAAVANHMTTIKKASDEAEALRATIVQIAESAEVSTESVSTSPR